VLASASELSKNGEVLKAQVVAFLREVRARLVRATYRGSVLE
jgi:hypothetical protein